MNAAAIRGRGEALHREVKGRDVLKELSLMGSALGHNRKAIVLSLVAND